MKFFQPRIHLLVSDQGTSGYSAPSELPVFYYTIAIFYKIFGVNESLIRIINLLIFFAGLYYLFRLLNKILKDEFWSAGLSILLFTSPLLVYYANNYLTNTSAFALGIIGLYHFFSYQENRNTSSLYYSALFYLLAGSFKITGLFMLFAILGYLLLRKPDTEKPRIREFAPYMIVLIIIGSWVLYARHYNTLHNTTHFSTTIFPIWNYDLKGIRGILEGIRLLWLPAYFNKYTLILLGLLGLSIPFTFRQINHLSLSLSILLLPIVILFAMLQFWTFRDHDYYIINLYILVIIVLAASVSGLQKCFPKAFRNYILKGLFAAFLLFNAIYAQQEYTKRYSDSGWMNENSKFLAFREIKEKLPEMGINPSDTAICLPGTSQLALYLVDMDGWTAYVDARFGREDPIFYNADSSGIAESINKGARYMFVLGMEEILQKPFLMDFTHSLAGQHNDLLVFDLRSDKRNFNLSKRRLKLELYCDMENLSVDERYFTTTVDSLMLDFGRSRSNEMSFSGKHSSKLSPKHAFSLSTEFEAVIPGESFNISAWIHDPSDKCRIIASGIDPNQFYNSRRTIEIEDSLGWKKIQTDFFVPEIIDRQFLKIYMYFSGSDSVYVDDFLIQYFYKPDLYSITDDDSVKQAAGTIF